MQNRPTMKKLDGRLRALARHGGFAGEAQVFDRKCRGWLREDGNRDGRGARADAIGQAFKGCRQFEKALRAQGHDDSTVCREAHKVVRGARHWDFPELLKRLSALWGQVSKADRRRAEGRRQAGARVRAVDRRLELRELRSLASLQEAGRALGNCMENRGHARAYLGEEDVEMWAVFCRRTGRPLYLAKVETADGREVTEFEGRGGSAPALKRSLARRLLCALDAHGDDHEVFAAAGAFSSCPEALPEVEAVEAEGGLHRVWVMGEGGEIVIASRWPADERWRWSRFTRCAARRGLRRRRRLAGGEAGTLDAGSCNRLSEGELLALALRYPALAEKLRGA